jgi:hypothetical protein
VIVFAAVVVWDVYMLTRPPRALPPAEMVVDLRWFVADAVDQIETMRAESGRLPARAELSDLVAGGIEYEISGAGYVVALTDGGVRVVYDGSLPLERWVAGEPGEGGGS